VKSTRSWVNEEKNDERSTNPNALQHNAAQC